MCLLAQVWLVMPLGLLSHFAKKQINCDRLSLARYVRKRDLIKHRHGPRKFLLHLSLLGRRCLLLLLLVLLRLGNVGSTLLDIVTVDLNCGHDLIEETGGLL